MTIKEKKQLFSDVSRIMRQNLPYYESDDKDDYVYLVRGQHINSATMRIVEYLTKKEQPLER